MVTALLTVTWAVNVDDPLAEKVIVSPVEAESIVVCNSAAVVPFGHDHEGLEPVQAVHEIVGIISNNINNIIVYFFILKPIDP
jgi:hypothetical protein